MLVGLFVGFGVARGFVSVSIAFLGGFVGSGHAVGVSASLTWCLPVGGLLPLLPMFCVLVLMLIRCCLVSSCLFLLCVGLV